MSVFVTVKIFDRKSGGNGGTPGQAGPKISIALEGPHEASLRGAS